MQRSRKPTSHKAHLGIRHSQRRRRISLLTLALAEREAARALASFGFHRNRVANRGRVAKRLALDEQVPGEFEYATAMFADSVPPAAASDSNASDKRSKVGGTL
jgi:hypothetical protein